MFDQIARLFGTSQASARAMAKYRRVFTDCYDVLRFPDNFDEEFMRLIEAMNSGAGSVESIHKMLHFLAYEGGSVILTDCVVTYLDDVPYFELIEKGLRFELADARAQAIDMLFERPVPNVVRLISASMIEEQDPYLLSESRRLLDKYG